MSKPVFVIVDSDSSYIASLEIKFLETLGDRIDLHIITEKSYYEEFFASPKQISVLIIDEDMYSENIRKHDIGNIFILGEMHKEDEEIGQLNTVKLNKYTGINDIYNKVVNTSLIKPLDEHAERKTEVILVTSAAGGVGKTTIALGMSQALAKEYKRVLYVNAENINSFQHFLGDESSLSVGNVISVFSAAQSAYEMIRPYIMHSSIDFIPPFAASLISMGIDSSIYKKIVDGAKNANEYDVIIVDTDSSFDLNKAFWLETADKVMIVTETSEFSIYATNKLICNISVTDKEKYFFLLNKCTGSNDDLTGCLNIKAGNTVYEKIEKITGIDKMTVEEIGNISGIKKAALLII